MRVGEVMEIAAGALGAGAAYVGCSTVGWRISLMAALVVVATLVAYAAQVHGYTGNPLRKQDVTRAESS